MHALTNEVMVSSSIIGTLGFRRAAFGAPPSETAGAKAEAATDAAPADGAAGAVGAAGVADAAGRRATGLSTLLLNSGTPSGLADGNIDQRSTNASYPVAGHRRGITAV